MKKILIMILAAVVLVFPVFTYAADEDGTGKTFNVKYDGNSFDDNFSSNDFDEVISGMEPGDSVVFTIAIENNAEETEWYVSNSVLKSFEDNEKASGGAYSYKLTYAPASGEAKELYSSDVVGGESTVGGTGLHQVPEEMKDYFFLDTLGKDAKGTVELEVGLDGETQGNSYQNADSALALQFAVQSEEGSADGDSDRDSAAPETEEEPEEEDIEDDEESADEEAEETSASRVKTGDENNIMLYAVLLIATGAALLVIAGRNLLAGAKEGSGDEEE